MLLGIQARIRMKISSRGWCYQLENYGLITKSQFKKVEEAINRCRASGLLPIDFVAEEPARQFRGVEEPTEDPIERTLAWMLRDVLNGAKYYTPDWWGEFHGVPAENCYIQCVVEKIDLITLFEPVCKEYHIPIATSKGWSSMLQRAEYARRFTEAEDKGLHCVLLYCGDHDPDGLRISDTLRANLEQLKDIVWEDETPGYNPEYLTIDRFGLNFDLIEELELSWIDNLETGSGMNLASRSHPNHGLPYVQDYIRDVGIRKCEANAIIPYPSRAQGLIRDAIEAYTGPDALSRFAAKRAAANEAYQEVLDRLDLTPHIRRALDQL